MTTEAFRVAGIGEILFDIFPEGKKMGGAPANFVYHSKMLGFDAHLVIAVGDDENGREICEKLLSTGISTEYVQHVSFPTGIVEVSLDSAGVPQYTINERVAWDHILWQEDARKLAWQVDVVCFGLLAQRSSKSYQCIQEFLKHTKDNCLRIFDVNLRQHYFSRDIIETSLQAANVLKLNEDERTVMQDMFGLPESIKKALSAILVQFNFQCIALTQGAMGSIMADRQNICPCPGFSVEVKDTVGGGDSFTAAVMMGKFYNLPLETTNRLAGKVVAYVCFQSGATPALPAELIAEFKACA